jgi:hypothetical protein
MNSLKNLLLLFLLTTLVLTSCTDHGEDPQPVTLSARAGADQTVRTGETVTLDGSASQSSPVQPFTYLWSFSKKPSSSTATLVGQTTPKATFVADVAGEYELELTLSGGGASARDKLLVTAAAALVPLVLDDITVNTVLEDRLSDPDQPDYLANKTVAVSARLTVKPGVVIAFAQDALLQVNEGGELIATGETSKKIRFTGKEARKGYWAGIMFYSNASGNMLSHSQILYAGSTPMISGVKAGLLVSEAARVSINNTAISQSGGYGLCLREGSILAGFARNAFSQNGQAPVCLTAENVPALDAASVFTAGNTVNAVEVMRSSVSGTAEAVWPALGDGTPYRFTGLITVQTGWKLSPGVTIEVAEDEHIEIANGYLHATGTADKKITFTGVVKTAGSWNGIILYPRSAFNLMEHVQMSYGGGNELVSGVKSSLVLTHHASLSIKGCTISNSGGYGIYIYDRNVSLNADAAAVNTFSANALAPVFYNED